VKYILNKINLERTLPSIIENHLSDKGPKFRMHFYGLINSLSDRYLEDANMALELQKNTINCSSDTFDKGDLAVINEFLSKYSLAETNELYKTVIRNDNLNDADLFSIAKNIKHINYER
jgi:hypothetical protein